MAFFEIKDKVALVTGGAGGIGLQFVLHLLEKEAKGVTIADIASDAETKVVQEIEKKYGKNKAIFVKTDTSNYEEFENAFKQTINTFKNIDILINNAGVFDDVNWQKEVAINLNGTINGTLLGHEKYLPKYKSGDEAVIVNISSITGVEPFGGVPIYGTTKFAVHGLTLSYGLPSHYNTTHVRVVGICPGFTKTAILENWESKFRKKEFCEMLKTEMPPVPFQSADQVGIHAMTVIEKAPTGTMWIIEAGEPPYEFKLPDRFTTIKNFLD